MATSLSHKSSTDEIRKRFDADVERFSNLETGQQAVVDAPLAMELISEAALAVTPQAKRILDIGCGAGNLTLKLLQQRDYMDCDLLDLSAPMLERAHKRVASVCRGNVQIFEGDIRDFVPEECNYDIILAAAVLHHLRDAYDWEDTFRKIFTLLAPGGSFWITDMVFHEIPQVHSVMWNRYGDYLEGIGGRDYREKVFAYIDKEDSPRPISFQLDLMKDVGFTNIDVLHKNSVFAAFGGIKEV